MAVRETHSTRLYRIEDKIDKLSDAIISLARVEEKIASMEKQLENIFIILRQKNIHRWHYPYCRHTRLAIHRIRAL